MNVAEIKSLLKRFLKKSWHILLAIGVGLIAVKMMILFGLLDK